MENLLQASRTGPVARQPNELRVLELYSGIGGMRHALSRVLCSTHVQYTAVDINRVANQVYEHNFRTKPRVISIEHLTAADFDRFECHVWALSPPCQPFTKSKNSKQLDVRDARCTSFNHILNVFDALRNPPLALVIENVVAFHGSYAHAQLQRVMAAHGYRLYEACMSPENLSIPYSRPRYFAVAVSSSVDLDVTENQFQRKLHAHLPAQCRQLQQYLHTDSVAATGPERPLSAYAVKPAALSKYFKVMDVVTLSSTTCNCFTKSYGKNMVGAGSFIATDEFVSKYCMLDTRMRLHMVADPLAHGDLSPAELLRLFTPVEICRLHGLPSHFTFPDETTLQQQFALLGNSLSVDCVEHVIRAVFEPIL